VCDSVNRGVDEWSLVNTQTQTDREDVEGNRDLRLQLYTS